MAQNGNDGSKCKKMEWMEVGENEMEWIKVGGN